MLGNIFYFHLSLKGTAMKIVEVIKTAAISVSDLNGIQVVIGTLILFIIAAALTLACQSHSFWLVAYVIASCIFAFIGAKYNWIKLDKKWF